MFTLKLHFYYSCDCSLIVWLQYIDIITVIENNNISALNTVSSYVTNAIHQRKTFSPDKKATHACVFV